jgi:outer membrane scaffolding protein for murein synthesis (MipA/OmpV family)
MAVWSGWRGGAGLLLAAAISVPAVAQETTPVQTETPAQPNYGAPDAPLTSPDASSTWIITVKATGNVSPDFLGAKTYTPIGYPLFSFRKADTPEGFSAADDGIDFSLYGNEYFNLGPVARYRSGRYNGSDKKLRGLKSIPWTVEVGGYVEVWPTEWLRGRVEVRHGLNGASGIISDFAVDAVYKQDKWTIAAGPRLTLATQDFMQMYFGVTPREAARSTRVGRYKPSGGIVSAGVLAGAGYQWDENWTVSLYGQYDRLVDQAANSPIVKNIGSANQFGVGATIGYSFPVKY